MLLSNRRAGDDASFNGLFVIRKFNTLAEADLWKCGGDEAAEPYDTMLGKNLFLNSGITELWNLLIGSSTHPFSNANVQIGVGDSTTAAVATQTDLLASANKYYQAADTAFPAVSGQSLIVQATFATGSANYAWNEIVVKNSASGICLDRIVLPFGTKSSSTTWVATATLTLS